MKEFPLYLLEVFSILKAHSDKNYLVGGCVRDILLNKTPNDFDVVTDVPIVDIISLFKDNGWKVQEAGQQFLVCILSKNGNSIEIANFRNDSTYIDGRRPESVSIGTIEEDAERRDISINSLYLNPYNGEIIDPTGNGLSDISNKIIRMNGNPEKRLKEDLLRIMRVYRFSAQFGFTIEKKTLSSCRKHFNEMSKKIPPERIKNEVEKIAHINYGTGIEEYPLIRRIEVMVGIHE